MKSGTITLIIDEKVIYEVSQPEVVFDGESVSGKYPLIIRQDIANIQTLVIDDYTYVFQNTEEIDGITQNFYTLEDDNVPMRGKYYYTNGQVNISDEDAYLTTLLYPAENYVKFVGYNTYLGINYSNPCIGTVMVATGKSLKAVLHSAITP